MNAALQQSVICMRCKQPGHFARQCSSDIFVDEQLSESNVLDLPLETETDPLLKKTKSVLLETLIKNDARMDGLNVGASKQNTYTSSRTGVNSFLLFWTILKIDPI